MNRNIFRAYDIRGLADSDLTDEVVENVGRAYGTTMKRSGGRVVSVGRDVRHSSDRIEKALVRGILSTGVDVIRIGRVTTPMTYYSIILKETDGSVMVTGSHNPIEFNGLKLNRGLLSLHGEQIQDLRRLIENGDYEEGSGNSREEKIDKAYKEMEMVYYQSRFSHLSRESGTDDWKGFGE